jgi:hypothetical protein
VTVDGDSREERRTGASTLVRLFALPPLLGGL